MVCPTAGCLDERNRHPGLILLSMAPLLAADMYASLQVRLFTGVWMMLATSCVSSKDGSQGAVVSSTRRRMSCNRTRMHGKRSATRQPVASQSGDGSMRKPAVTGRRRCRRLRLVVHGRYSRQETSTWS